MNSHPQNGDQPLKLARLPISPSELCYCYYTKKGNGNHDRVAAAFCFVRQRHFKLDEECF